MKLEVLGSGSTGNCYLLHTSNGIIIIEAGIKWSEVLEALNFDVSNILCCLVSHEHGDHGKYAKEYAQRGGFQLVMTNGTADSLSIPPYLLQNNVEKLGIKMFETQHDAVEPCGFYIRDLKTNESLVFATDTYYVKYKFPPVNYIMVECNYAEDTLQKNMDDGYIDVSRAKRLLKSHFELSRVKDFIKANNTMNLSNVILLHLSSKNSDSKRFKDEVGSITLAMVEVASKGLKIDLGSEFIL